MRKLRSVREFAGLGWQDQLAVASKAISDPDWYMILSGLTDYQLDDPTYKALLILQERGATEPPTLSDYFPIQIIRHFAGYRLRAASRLIRSVAERLFGIELSRVINVRLADFPLLVLDRDAAIGFEHLATRMGGLPLLRETIRIRAASECFGMNPKNPRATYAKALVEMPGDLEDVVGTYGVVDESEALAWAFKNVAAPQCVPMKFGTWTMYPMVPARLLAEGLHVEDAGLLR